MQRLLLVRPRPDRETIGLQHVMVCEPLELEYLAANLAKPGRGIELVDLILEKRSLRHFLEKLKPTHVLLTAYISHVGVIKKLAGRIKEWDSGCQVIVGGVHAEVVPEDFDCPAIDHVVRANPIPTVAALLDGADPSALPGLHASGLPYRKEASFSLLCPDRSLSRRYRARYYYMFHNPCALIKTSFGCPYSCTFCFCREITDGQYFARPIPDIIAELRGIPEREIYIVDDDFLFNESRLLAFCDALDAAGLDKRFLVYGRADFIAAHEPAISRFAASGLRAVIVGLESARSGDLDAFNKKSRLADNEAAAAVLQRHGIELYGTLILGPDFTKQDFRNLGDWLLRHKINFVNLQPLTPLPGTALFDEYADRLIVPRKDYARWDLAHLVLRPKAISARAYYWQILRLYYRVVGRPQHARALISRYGRREVLRLWLGSCRVSLQYLAKTLRGY